MRVVSTFLLIIAFSARFNAVKAYTTTPTTLCSEMLAEYPRTETAFNVQSNFTVSSVQCECLERGDSPNFRCLVFEKGVDENGSSTHRSRFCLADEYCEDPQVCGKRGVGEPVVPYEDKAWLMNLCEDYIPEKTTLSENGNDNAASGTTAPLLASSRLVLAIAAVVGAAAAVWGDGIIY